MNEITLHSVRHSLFIKYLAPVPKYSFKTDLFELSFYSRQGVPFFFWDEIVSTIQFISVIVAIYLRVSAKPPRQTDSTHVIIFLTNFCEIRPSNQLRSSLKNERTFFAHCVEENFIFWTCPHFWENHLINIPYKLVNSISA